MSKYDLSVDEVYSRQKMYGFQLAPGGKRLSFLYQRDVKFVEKNKDGIGGMSSSPVVDVCYFLPGDNYCRVLYSSCQNVGSMPMWAPDGRRFVWVKDNAILVVDDETGDSRVVFRSSLYSPHISAGDKGWGSPQWSPKGNLIAFVVREEGESTLCVLSTDGNILRKVHCTSDLVLTWSWSQ